MPNAHLRVFVSLCVWFVLPFVGRAAELAMPTKIFGKRVSVKDGHLVVGFNILADFPFDHELLGLTPEDLLAKVPLEIRSLDGKLVVIRGMMMPTALAKEGVTEFLLMPEKFQASRLPICNTSLPTHLNQWVVVHCSNQPVKDSGIDPVSLFGRLKVSVLTESGYTVGIYSLDLERVVEETLETKPTRARRR